MAGRKPDYRLKVLNKETDDRGTVGAGWKNADGSISIKLDPCVVLQHNPDIVINLFPAEWKGKEERKSEAGQEDAPY